MGIPNEQKDLKSIKEKFVIFPRKCKCCDESYIFAKMFCTKRYRLNMTVVEEYYCKRCTPEKADVLKLTDDKEPEYNITSMDVKASFRK